MGWASHLGSRMLMPKCLLECSCLSCLSCLMPKLCPRQFFLYSMLSSRISREPYLMPVAFIHEPTRAKGEQSFDAQRPKAKADIAFMQAQPIHRTPYHGSKRACSSAHALSEAMHR